METTNPVEIKTVRTLHRIIVKVKEPYSGGCLIIKDDGVQALPPIFLASLPEPSLWGLDPALANYMKNVRGKCGYTFITDDLYLHCLGEVSYEITGGPTENVIVELVFD